MTTKEYFIKTFKKSEAVIAKRIDESGRMTTHWVIPSPDNTIRLLGQPDSFVLHKDARFLSTKWNIPTYFFTYKSCEPIALDDLKREHFYTSIEIDLILESDLAQKAYRSQGKGKISDEIKMVLIVLIVGFIALGYFFNSQIQNLNIDPVDPTAPIVVTEVD